MALTAGWRHHGSRRSVLLAICALALAGACVTCVIDASALRHKPIGPVSWHWERNWIIARALLACSPAGPEPCRGKDPVGSVSPVGREAERDAALPALPTEPYSHGNHHADTGVASAGGTLATRRSWPALHRASPRPEPRDQEPRDQEHRAGSRPGAAAGSRRPPPARPCASRRTAEAPGAAARPRAAPRKAGACARRPRCRRPDRG